MSTVGPKTYMPKPGEIERKWYVVDAAGQSLGRMASRVAAVLRGKHKPQYSTSVDVGDFVIIVNAEKVRLTGRKSDGKIHYRHSGYPGGLTATPYGKMIAEKPERAVELAVRRMLPRNSLGRRMFTKLKVFRGTEHPHAAQGAQNLDLDTIR